MFALQAAAGFITASCSRPSVICRVPRRESDSPPESKTITVAVSQAAPPSSRLLLSECQLFLKLVSPLRAPPPPPAASPPLLSHGDVGPAIAVGQSCRCLRCARRASVWREAVTGLSPPALTHLEKREILKKKERREAEGAGCFAEHLPPAAESHSPSDKEKEKKSIS